MPYHQLPTNAPSDFVPPTMKKYQLPVNRVEAAAFIVDGLRRHFSELGIDFSIGNDEYTFLRDVYVNGERWTCAKSIDVWTLANVQPKTILDHLIDLFKSEPMPKS